MMGRIADWPRCDHCRRRIEPPWRGYFRIVGFRIDATVLCVACGQTAKANGWTATDEISIDHVLGRDGA